MLQVPHHRGSYKQKSPTSRPSSYLQNELEFFFLVCSLDMTYKTALPWRHKIHNNTHAKSTAIIFTVYSEGTLLPWKFLCLEEELFRFRMFSSCALRVVMPLGEGILRIMGCLGSTPCASPLILRMPTPCACLTLLLLECTLERPSQFLQPQKWAIIENPTSNLQKVQSWNIPPQSYLVLPLLLVNWNLISPPFPNYKGFQLPEVKGKKELKFTRFVYLLFIP